MSLQTLPPAQAWIGRRRSLRRALPLLLLALIVSADAAPFRLISGTVDSGGTHSQGAHFAVEGTVGQPDADVAQGTRFRVDGGFWPTAAASTTTDSLFRDSFED